MTGLLVFETLSGGNGFTARPGGDRAGHHRTARRRVAAGRAGRPAGRREPAADHRRPARRAAGRVPGRLGRRGRRPQRRRAPGAERRCRSPARRSSPRTRGRGPGCGTPARASTPPSPRPGRRAPPRCWRTSSSRCRRCWTPANELTSLFARHGYDDSVIFGHAKDGNIHFMLTEQLGGGGPLDRFVGFTEDLVGLVLGQGGSLKAEHGTGRMMAPYVRRQYGDELYEVMRDIKRLCDPARHAQPGRADQRRPRRPHPPPQGHPDRRGGGRPVRGMWLLRTGLPQQGPHHDPAAADRAAPRDAAGRGRR